MEQYQKEHIIKEKSKAMAISGLMVYQNSMLILTSCSNDSQKLTFGDGLNWLL